MKKVIAFVLAIIFVISLAACGKSEEEKALDRAKEELEHSKQEAEDAKNSYNSFKKDVDDYKRLVDRLK